MKFKTDNSFLFVEGIQFINGEYETIDKKEIKILKRYDDSISVTEDDKSETKNKIVEESTDETKVTEEETSKKTKKTE